MKTLVANDDRYEREWLLTMIAQILEALGSKKRRND